MTERTGEETIRVHQANERTMLAWIRTGIALMAFGFAIARFGLFLRQVTAFAHAPSAPFHGIGSEWLGAALVALGMLANLVATIRYAHIRRAIAHGEVGAPDAVTVYAFGAIATVIGVVMTVLLLRAVGE